MCFCLSMGAPCPKLQRADKPLSLKCKSSTAERTFTRAVANVNMSIEALKTGLD